MKSHGILSRYVRPGFKEGGDSLWNKTKEVFKKMGDGSGDTMYDLAEQQQEEKDRTTEDWRRKKLNYFRGYNVALVERKRDAGDDSYWHEEDDPTQSGFTAIDPNLFDEEKIRDGTQMIFNLDDEGYIKADGTGFLGSQGFQDIPFMFYESQDDLDYFLDKTNLDDMAMGRPYADDTKWYEKFDEMMKFADRGIVGGLATLPEWGAAGYRFLNPVDAWGGVGPYDTFNPKNEAQKELVESSDYYRLPGYSEGLNWLTGDKDRPAGTVPSNISPRDSSLYKDTLYEDETYSDLFEKNRMRNEYAGKDDEFIANDIINKYQIDIDKPGVFDEVMTYVQEDIRPTLDMSEKEFDRDIWMGNRDNLSHSKPAWMANMAASFRIPLIGPAGVTGSIANIASKGNKFSKAIKKAKEGSRTLRWGDSSLGLGVPQGTGEYAVRKFQEAEDEDSIYPVDY